MRLQVRPRSRVFDQHRHRVPTISLAVDPRVTGDGTHRPALHAPVTWHSFDPDTFEIGRTTVSLDADATIGL